MSRATSRPAPGRNPRSRPPSRLPFHRPATGVSPEPLPDGPVTIEGVLDHFIFSNEENGWGVARVLIADAREITAVGTLLGVRAGESVRLSGRWQVDGRYGQQLRVESFLAIQPRTMEGIEKYLGSGLIPGVGVEMARRLVRRFGSETLNVIEGDAERLTEVAGIGRRRSEAIRAAWREQKAVRDAMIFLGSHSIGPSQAARIVRTYGENSVARVRGNPYSLAADVTGIGFLTADRIASSLGVPRSAPERLKAGIVHALNEAADEGHVFLPRGELLEAASALLSGGGDAPDPAALSGALAALARTGAVVVEADADGPHGKAGPASDTADEEPDDRCAVFLPALHAAETGVASALRALLSAPSPVLAIDTERALTWFETLQRISLAPAQREAIRSAIGGRLLVITGGPGTGKTTLVNGIIRILEKKNQRVALAAPTGRAARRMSEATGREAKTIHRLLEFHPVEHRFQRGPGRPLEADIVVLDEASMVDVTLMYHLLCALPAEARLVIVGDADQLPSVGPGSVLRDLIASRAVATVALSEIFRQGEGSAIVRNAHRIHRGEMPEFLSPDTREGGGGSEPDFFFIPKEDPADILETVRELVSRRIPRRFGFDPVEDIQVLVPMHRGELGAANLNVELQALLNPDPGGGVTAGTDAPGSGASPGGAPSAPPSAPKPAAKESSPRPTRPALRAGDKVMQMRNNYALEVFNGDIGRIVSIEPGARAALVRFDERTLRYEQADLDELALAYACSVHKSQGSEYPAVVIPLHTQHYMLLQRNLLYTAVTRGRKLVVIVGSRRALAAAVRNDRIRQRHTRLAERLSRPSSSPTSS